MESLLTQPITDEERRLLNAESPGMWPNHARTGLIEIERIQAERAASEKWNATPEAAARRHNLECAAAVLRICASMTYFETN